MFLNNYDFSRVDRHARIVRLAEMSARTFPVDRPRRENVGKLIAQLFISRRQWHYVKTYEISNQFLKHIDRRMVKKGMKKLLKQIEIQI